MKCDEIQNQKGLYTTKNIKLFLNLNICCRESDRFESRHNTASKLRTLKMVPSAAMSGERHN